jgi:hypothetical protein
MAACGKGSTTGPSVATEAGELTVGEHVFRGEIPKGWDHRGANATAPSGGSAIDVRTISRSEDLSALATKKRDKTVEEVILERGFLKELGNADLIPKGMGDAHDVDKNGRKGFVVMTRTPGESGSRSADPGYVGDIYWQADGFIARCRLKLHGEHALAYRAFIDICLGFEATKKP